MGAEKLLSPWLLSQGTFSHLTAENVSRVAAAAHEDRESRRKRHFVVSDTRASRRRREC